MQVSIIIVNYNTTDHLSKCIDSIFTQTGNLDFEVIVVDNNSANREIENFKIKYKNVQLYLRNVNDGFGGGSNFGAGHATGKYLAFINPDIVFLQNNMLEFFNYMEMYADVGLCSGILVNEKLEPIYSFNKFPGVLWELSEAFIPNGAYKINKLLTDKNLNSNPPPFEIDWAIGACIFIRKELFDKLSGFDTDLFLYSEDVDLQLRLNENGYKIMCLPGNRLMHYSKSSVRDSGVENTYYYNTHKSKLLYMYKHFNLFERNIVRIAFISGIIIRICALPFRNKFRFHKFDKFKQLLNILKYYFTPRKSLTDH